MDDTQEANSNFYSEDYFLAGSGGAALYQDTKGAALDHYKERALSLSLLKAGEKILDIGCGRGEFALACLRRGCEVWALDFSRSALQLTLKTVSENEPALEKRLHLARCDAVEMNFEPDFFDCVVTSDFVEHILPRRLSKVFNKVHNSLKEGGRFIIHTSPTIGYMYFGQYIARTQELMGGKPVQPLHTFKSQLRDGGHCNIQSVRSLRKALQDFRQFKVWAEFSLDQGRMKQLLKRLQLTPLLAHHLYSVAYK